MIFENFKQKGQILILEPIHSMQNSSITKIVAFSKIVTLIWSYENITIISEHSNYITEGLNPVKNFFGIFFCQFFF